MTENVEFITDDDEPQETVEEHLAAPVLADEIDTDPENIVEVTQRVRGSLLKEITQHGQTLPTDKEGVDTLLSVMKDMDHTALTTRKLKIEDKKANSAAEIASIADSILSKMALGSGQGPTRDIGKDLDLPEIEFHDGETDQGEVSLNPDEWLTDRE